MKPRLPPELILHIIDQLIPSDLSPIARPPSDPITRTLVSFTLASHTTYPTAIRHLYAHCLYIDTSQSLRRLLTSIMTPPLPTLWSPDFLASITTLYLAPFDTDSIDDQPTAHWVQELFLRVAPTLKRLVIDMPLRSVYPFNDHLGVRPILRRGFEALVHLEEFVSVRDELYLHLHEPEENVFEETVWTAWTKLRRLGLYNAYCTSGFWRNIGRMPGLETVVLTRPDGLDDADIKAELLPRTMKVLIVNTAIEQRKCRGARAWPEIDPEGRVRVMRYNVPSSYYVGENPIELCWDWVRSGAVRGVMWDWEGVLLPGV